MAGLVAGFAVAWGPEGFWACVPGALVLAGAEPTARAALASGALVVLAAAVAAPPPLMPALVVVPASLGVLLALRARLERERDAMRGFALRDPLTGLANRRALDERLGYEIARHTRHGESFSVLALDLDGFKAVNDRFGHDAGDEVLCETADRARRRRARAGHGRAARRRRVLRARAADRRRARRAPRRARARVARGA